MSKTVALLLRLKFIQNRGLAHAKAGEWLRNVKILRKYCMGVKRKE